MGAELRINPLLSTWNARLLLARDNKQDKSAVLCYDDTVQNDLEKRFGSGLVNRAYSQCKINKDAPLTLEQYRTLLVAIAASVTIKDLDIYFRKLKSTPDSQWARFRSFKELSDSKVCALLHHFRAHITPDRWKELSSNAIMASDLQFLRACSTARDFKFAQDQDIATSEHLAHEAAYTYLQKGRILPVRNSKGKMGLERVSHFINKHGYVCAILTPLQREQHLNDFGVRVLFRGTHDKLSASRLGEPGSAGHLSSKRHQIRLVNSIGAAIHPKAKRAHIQITGHSLGGADTQRACTSLTFAMAHNAVAKTHPEQLQEDFFKKGLRSFSLLKKEDIDDGELQQVSAKLQRLHNTLAKVKKVEARVVNSAGIAQTTNARFQKSFEHLESVAQENGKKVPAYKISVLKVDGDPVQMTGETTLGHDMPANARVEREVMQFYHGFGGLSGCLCYLGRSGIKAHQVKNLNRAVVPDHVYMNSKNDPDGVEKATGDHFFSYRLCFLWKLWEKIKWFVVTLLFGNPLQAAPADDE